MNSRITTASTVASLIWLVLPLLGKVAHADPPEHENRVVSLPAHIAETLRQRNRGGRGGCPTSSIFVHGFRYLGIHLDRTMWFLGAPDYLCGTNSFVPVIVSSSGEWTPGWASEKGWQGSRMLSGVPVLFQHSTELGYFLTSEWQVEAPINFLYHSADGETWKSVDLPSAARKISDDYCCYAASIQRLCIAEPGSVLIVYAESEQFHASTWSATVDDSFPANVTWTRLSELPDCARCDGVERRDFMPRSLREKTGDGAVFDVSLEWAVRIPGPTK